MKTTVLLSGGMDSATLLYYAKEEGDVAAFSVYYGQRHDRELRAARTIAQLFEAEHQVLDIGAISDILPPSALTHPFVPVPEGHYEEESMKQTVVPNRNMIMLSLATAWAIRNGSNRVAWAAHAGDHAIYPDCREEFADAMHEAITLCDWNAPYLWYPFTRKTKADIVTLGTKLGVPFGLTWSCYKGGVKHCGKCGTCVERIEAFQLAGVDDPTEYE